MLPNVSNSSEISQGSLVGPISVHFRGFISYTLIQGPQEGSEAIFLPYFGILNNFPHFLWMNNFIEYTGFCWRNIFLNEYFGFWFELNFELNHFSARFNEKMNFQNVSNTPTPQFKVLVIAMVPRCHRSNISAIFEKPTMKVTMEWRSY